MDGWTVGYIATEEQTDRWIDMYFGCGWMDGRTDGRMDGWMDGWTDEWLG